MISYKVRLFGLWIWKLHRISNIYEKVIYKDVKDHINL
jgi:hypothetical protein